MKHSIITFIGTLLIAGSAGAAGVRANFTLSGQSAFLITPTTAAAGNPWIAYAPAVGGLPDWNSSGGSGAEQWMFDQYLANGIAIAGIYAGDLSGNTDQRAGYTNLYSELINNRGYAEKFSFHTRSRGGLLGYNWAADNPDKVAAIGGIYSVTNLLSYPGYTQAQIDADPKLDNPIVRLADLVANDVSVFHIHGDNDSVVPIGDNTQIVKDYFDANGGDATLTVIAGGGHDMNAHWWNNQPLTDFMINETLTAAVPEPSSTALLGLGGLALIFRRRR
jgi:pimeloyl-ACP methyl ester carboxylesterase